MRKGIKKKIIIKIFLNAKYIKYASTKCFFVSTRILAIKCCVTFIRLRHLWMTLVHGSGQTNILFEDRCLRFSFNIWVLNFWHIREITFSFSVSFLFLKKLISLIQIWNAVHFYRFESNRSRHKLKRRSLSKNNYVFRSIAYTIDMYVYRLSTSPSYIKRRQIEDRRIFRLLKIIFVYCTFS